LYGRDLDEQIAREMYQVARPEAQTMLNPK
jgi:hypothetical protein